MVVMTRLPVNDPPKKKHRSQMYETQMWDTKHNKFEYAMSGSLDILLPN